MTGKRRAVILRPSLSAGGSVEAQELVRRLAAHKAQDQPPALRGALFQAYFVRWWNLLSLAVQRAVAQSLLGCEAPPGSMVPGPGLEELLTLDAELPAPSRLA